MSIRTVIANLQRIAVHDTAVTSYNTGYADGAFDWSRGGDADAADYWAAHSGSLVDLVDATKDVMVDDHVGDGLLGWLMAQLQGADVVMDKKIQLVRVEMARATDTLDINDMRGKLRSYQRVRDLFRNRMRDIDQQRMQP